MKWQIILVYILSLWDASCQNFLTAQRGNHKPRSSNLQLNVLRKANEFYSREEPFFEKKLLVRYKAADQLNIFLFHDLFKQNFFTNQNDGDTFL